MNFSLRKESRVWSLVSQEGAGGAAARFRLPGKAERSRVCSGMRKPSKVERGQVLERGQARCDHSDCLAKRDDSEVRADDAGSWQRRALY